jgi:hypothetical protein
MLKGHVFNEQGILCIRAQIKSHDVYCTVSFKNERFCLERLTHPFVLEITGVTECAFGQKKRRKKSLYLTQSMTKR